MTTPMHYVVILRRTSEVDSNMIAFLNLAGSVKINVLRHCFLRLLVVVVALC